MFGKIESFGDVSGYLELEGRTKYIMSLHFRGRSEYISIVPVFSVNWPTTEVVALQPILRYNVPRDQILPMIHITTKKPDANSSPLPQKTST